MSQMKYTTLKKISSYRYFLLLGNTIFASNFQIKIMTFLQALVRLKSGYRIEHKSYGSFTMKGSSVVDRNNVSRPYHIFCLICDNVVADTDWSASLPEEVRSELAKINA